VAAGRLLRFDEVVEQALYGADGGFYSGGRGAGRAGADFITSPEVGALFGAVLAGSVVTWWEDLGRPEPFTVVEAGAGRGTLAASILGTGLPAAIRYVAVERSAALRAVAAERLGDRAQVVDELPAGPFDGVVLANELLDNLPFRLLERTAGGWEEVFVDENLSEVLVPASADGPAGAAVGARIPVQDRARDWVAAAVGSLRRGRVVVFDYADTTASMASRPWSEWVRTYRGHGRAGHPLHDLGSADITCEVAVDQLPRPTTDRSQAEFLRAHGLDDLVAAARDEWQARAHVGDLAALKARSRVTEGAALTDPSGLGGFRVLEWEVPGRLDVHG
jgi:SAM-dependent MidA family methyltransferase